MPLSSRLGANAKFADRLDGLLDWLATFPADPGEADAKFENDADAKFEDDDDEDE